MGTNDLMGVGVSEKRTIPMIHMVHLQLQSEPLLYTTRSDNTKEAKKKREAVNLEGYNTVSNAGCQ